MHGYRSLEGTFLGGCLFSGRIAGRAAAAAALSAGGPAGSSGSFPLPSAAVSPLVIVRR
jgi:succinate dehydrogenase/fumarate reductase flavoprotein subunit